MRTNARRAYAAMLATAAAGLAYACTPFGAEADAADTSRDDASADGDTPTARDAGSDDRDDADANGADAGTSCATFGPAGTAGFTVSGNASVAADGVTLSLAHTSASLTKTFEANGTITRSVVEVSFRFTSNGAPWGAANGDFVDFVSQFYGTVPEFQSSATTAFAFADNAVDLDVWSAPNVYAGSTPAFLPLPAGGVDLEMTIVTTWGGTGEVVVTADKTHTKTIATNTGPASKKLTLVVGGQSSGTVPDIRLLVKRVCVTLQ